MATLNDNRINVHGATLTRRQFVKTGGALIVGFSLAGRSLWDKTAEAAAGTEFARRHAGELVVRDSRRQHDPHAHGQGGLRSDHSAHGVQADRRRGAERPVRGHYRGRDGRHRSDAGRRVFRGVPRVRRRQHSQGRGLHLSGAARSGGQQAPGGQEPAFGEGRRRVGRRQENLLRRARARASS